MNNTAVTVPHSLFESVGKKTLPESILSKVVNTGHNVSKFQCINALKGKNPREAVCIVDKASGKLLTTAFGDAESCVVDLGVAGLKGRDLILYHGHAALPSGKTLPVSLQDFLIMNNSNIGKIVAFDVKGNQSFLKKNPQFVPLTRLQQNALKSEYQKALLTGSQASEIAKIKELKDYILQHPEATGVKVEIAERLTALQKSDSAKGIIDKFWRLNAHKYNLTYFSDM